MLKPPAMRRLPTTFNCIETTAFNCIETHWFCNDHLFITNRGSMGRWGVPVWPTA